MEIKMVSVSDIIPYENNPRKNADAVKYVKNSIEQFGFKIPMVLDANNVIVCGHTRFLAEKKLGMKEVPCTYADDLTEEQIKAFRLADNKTAEFAEWDIDKLAIEMQGLPDINMADFGFLDEIGDMDEAAEITEDTPPEVEEGEPITVLGDLWIIGKHRLICGDSTDIAVINRLMDGIKADMVMTDAPYGVSAVNSEGTVIGYGEKHLAERGKYAPIIGDDTTETAQQAYDILSQICDKLILWGGNYFLDFLPASDGWLIWDKRGESGIRNNFADGEMAWCSFHTPIRIYHQLWNGMIREGEHEKRVHPTQKPIRMLSEILQDFTNEGDIILDVFGGSGSTLIACEQTGRTCYMAELSPEYVDVIIARWEKLTGNKAVLLT